LEATPDDAVGPAVSTSPSRLLSARALDQRIEDLDEIVSALGLDVVRRAPAIVSGKLPQGGTIHVLRCGAVVSEGVDDPDRVYAAVESATAARFRSAAPERLEVRIGSEPPLSLPRVGWNRVHLPEDRQGLVGAVVLLLGQSAALERHEAATAELVREALELARVLAGRRLPRSTAKLVGRVGEVLRHRLELAQGFHLVDRPDEAWDDPQVARLFDDLSHNLELDERHQAMLHKLSAVEHSCEAALELWHGRRSHALEWAIVLLIVVEILLAAVGYV
jgi:uncharacterized Rmd1/YagE family protein